jgi:hypothetical protein
MPNILNLLSKESLGVILFKKQEGLCPSCGFALDEDTVIIHNLDPQSLDDYKLVCRGVCQDATETSFDKSKNGDKNL